jgi:hypothetical protein
MIIVVVWSMSLAIAQVLGRFGVSPQMIPCMRVAQIYPEERGGGMEIFMPDKIVSHATQPHGPFYDYDAPRTLASASVNALNQPPNIYKWPFASVLDWALERTTQANGIYQDKKPRTKAAFDAFVTDHLAEGDPLKGGRLTVPFLRSEQRAMKSHPHVVDLVGNTYDNCESAISCIYTYNSAATLAQPRAALWCSSSRIDFPDANNVAPLLTLNRVVFYALVCLQTSPRRDVHVSRSFTCQPVRTAVSSNLFGKKLRLSLPFSIRSDRLALRKLRCFA